MTWKTWPVMYAAPSAGQESYHLGHLAGSPDALERHLGQQRLARLGRDGRRHVGLDEPGATAFTRIVPVRQLARARPW